jgi:hypothetical protein
MTDYFTKKHIADERRNLEQWDRAERDRLLEAHYEVARVKRLALYEKCEKENGHVYVPNRGTWRNWPDNCQWCGMQKPHTPDEQEE